jgi:hypothetical protein
MSILRQLTPAMTTDAVHLFEPAAATRSVSRGVAIDYYLRSATDKLTLELLDASGRVIRTMTEPPPQDTEPMPDGITESSRAPIPGLPARPGVNRFVWDLRSAPLRDFPGLIMYQTDTRGPMMPPGRYQVRLTANGRSLTQQIVVKKDTRLKDVADADLAEQFQFATEIGAAFSRTSDMIVRIRRIKAQIAARLDDVRDPAVRAAGDKLTADLTAIEGELYQYRNRATKDPLNFPPKLNNKIAVLLSVVDSGDGKPTEQSYSVFRQLSVALAAEQARLDALVARDLAAFNAQLARMRKMPVS